MILSSTKKFLFIHIPKTGGMSIKECLEKYATMNMWQHNWKGLPKQMNKNLKKHATAKTIQKYVSKWNTYFKFAFVRNPWDWFLSVFLYIKKDSTDPRNAIAKKLGFSKFVQWFYNVNGNKYPIRNGQSHYIFNAKNVLLVDCIGRFESLKNDFSKICLKLNINKKLGHKNKTVHKHYRNYYNTTTKIIIEKMFKRDIEYFKYVF